MKSGRARWRIGIFVVAATGIGVVGYYFAWRNPLLPNSNWPTLQAARTDSSQSVHVRVLGETQVDFQEDGIEYWECDLAADPKNASRLFATTLVHTPRSTVPRTPGRLASVAGFYSHDAGASWHRAFFFTADTGNTDPAQREAYVDPSVCWGNDGSVHFVVMHGRGYEPFVPKRPGDKPPRKEHRVDFWKSDDAGVTWEKRSGIPYFLDRPFTVVDTSPQSGTGQQYTIAQDGKVLLFVNDEDDEKIGQGIFVGRPFVNPRPANPVVLRDGTVLLVVEEMHPKWMGTVRPDAARQIRTFRYVDGGLIEEGTPVNTQWSHGSIDNAARPRFTFFPRLGANPDSDKYADHVYCVWGGGVSTTNPNADHGCVFVSVSRDTGQTWGQPVVLSEQSLDGGHVFLSAIPTVAVNRDGVVAVSWYDRRGMSQSEAQGENDSAKRDGWTVRVRISVDGGASWLPSAKLNRESSTSGFDVGHTAGLAAAANGRFHALWIDARDGTRQLYTATFYVESKNGESGLRDENVE